MKIIKFLILIVIVLFAISAPAEIYKYVDEQGNGHFTDDINQVPKDQRNSYAVRPEYIAETEDTETDSQALTESEGLDEDSDNGINVALSEDGDSLNQSDNDQDGLDAGRQRLDALKKEIDQEYRALVKEKEKLAEEQKALTTRADIISYNTEVEDLNKRAEAYVQKGKQYREQVEAFNERVMQENAQSNQKKE